MVLCDRVGDLLDRDWQDVVLLYRDRLLLFEGGVELREEAIISLLVVEEDLLRIALHPRGEELYHS